MYATVTLLSRQTTVQNRYSVPGWISSLVTVYGALGSLTGGSCTGTGLGSSVGVAGASSAGSRSRGSDLGFSGVCLYSVMHDGVHDRYRKGGTRARQRFLPRGRPRAWGLLELLRGRAPMALKTGSCLVTLSSAASSTDSLT